MGNGNENINDDKNIKEFENMVEEEKTLEKARINAEIYVNQCFDEIAYNNAQTCAVKFEQVLDIAQHNLDFHAAIWHASTVILPNLEVQVVIDSNNKCHVSTGSAGYVDFQINPVGMKLPIRCWIHTHPFGAAYFSGTDIRTVSIWEQIMETAYVLGGEGHYGFWTNREPKKLDIYVNNSHKETQIWYGEEE